MLSKTTKYWESGVLQFIIVFLILQLAVTLLTNGFALTFDEALWQYIGRNWFRHGLVPYAGGVDNQSPLLFAIFGLSDRLFGVNYWFPRVIGTLCQTVGLLYVYKIAHYVAGKTAGILAIMFYGLSLLWHVTGGQYTAYAESYEVMFLVIAVYYFITAQTNTYFIITGCFAGLALGCRISAFFVIGAIFISILSKGWKNLLPFCAGIWLSMVCLAMAGFLAGINLHDYYIYAFADNFNKGSMYDHTLLWKWQQFSLKFLSSQMLLFYPLVIGYVFIKKRVDIYLLWFVFAFIGIAFIGEFTWIHLKELLPALSLMSAFTVAHLINAYKIPVKYALAVIVVAFFPFITEPVYVLKDLLFSKNNPKLTTCTPPYTWPDEGTRKKLGWWVRDHTNAHQEVFVAGFGSQILAYSERQSVYFDEMLTPMAKKLLFKDLVTHKPAMILVPLFPEYQQYISGDERAFVDSLVADNYQLDKCMDSYNIYRLKDKTPPN